jgi:DNA-binding MurR/RpiR family transcriptional regulator
LGRYADAKRLLPEELASHEKTFEPGHTSIARSQSNLGTVLRDLGQLEEARDLLRKAHQTYLSGFGPDHPATRIIRRNLDSLADRSSGADSRPAQ